MAGPGFTIFEDVTTFDIVWKRVSDNKEQLDPGEPGDSWAFFTVERAPTPASSSATQGPSTSPVPMIVTFDWDICSAEFSCNYNPTSRSYDHFDLVEGSLSQEFADALCVADRLDNQPHLSELNEGIWKLEMYMTYMDLAPSYVELWAKRSVNGVQATATDEDLREWGFGSGGIEEEWKAKEAEKKQENEQEQLEEGHSGA